MTAATERWDGLVGALAGRVTDGWGWLVTHPARTVPMARATAAAGAEAADLRIPLACLILRRRETARALLSGRSAHDADQALLHDRDGQAPVRVKIVPMARPRASYVEGVTWS